MTSPFAFLAHDWVSALHVKVVFCQIVEAAPRNFSLNFLLRICEIGG
jgi:hypothetical protein